MHQTIVLACICGLVAAQADLPGERGRPIQHFTHDYASLTTVYLGPTPAAEQLVPAVNERDASGGLTPSELLPVPVFEPHHKETPSVQYFPPPKETFPPDWAKRDVEDEAEVMHHHPEKPGHHRPENHPVIDERAAPVESSPHGPAGPVAPFPEHPGTPPPPPSPPSRPPPITPVQHPAAVGVANEERAVDPVSDSLPGLPAGWQPPPSSQSLKNNKNPHHEREAEPALPNPVAALSALHASYVSAGEAKITSTTGNVNYDAGYVDKRAAPPEPVYAERPIGGPIGPVLPGHPEQRPTPPGPPQTIPTNPM